MKITHRRKSDTRLGHLAKMSVFEYDEAEIIGMVLPAWSSDTTVTVLDLQEGITKTLSKDILVRVLEAELILTEKP